MYAARAWMSVACISVASMETHNIVHVRLLEPHERRQKQNWKRSCLNIRATNRVLAVCSSVRRPICRLPITCTLTPPLRAHTRHTGRNESQLFNMCGANSTSYSDSYMGPRSPNTSTAHSIDDNNKRLWAHFYRARWKFNLHLCLNRGRREFRAMYLLIV